MFLAKCLRVGPRLVSASILVEVVGQYRDKSGVTHGFLLNADGFTAIDFPGAQQTVATGINPKGDIVGRYRDSIGKDHAFLLVR